MRTAIIAYDLKNVKLGDNKRVKDYLSSHPDTSTTYRALDKDALSPQWFDASLPDTTLLLTVADPTITAEQIARRVSDVIYTLKAEPNRIYVAFIANGTNDTFIIN